MTTKAINGVKTDKTHMTFDPPIFSSVVIGSQSEQDCSPPLPEPKGIMVAAPRMLMLQPEMRHVLPVCIAWMMPPRARDGKASPTLLAQSLETGARLTATLWPEVEDDEGAPVIQALQDPEDNGMGVEPLDAGWLAVDAFERIPAMAAPGTWRLTVTFGTFTSVPVQVVLR